MSKQYALDLQRLNEIDGGGFMGWYSKGHHEASEFLKAIGDYDGIPGVDLVSANETLYRLNPGKVGHEWWRNVPWGPDGEMIFSRTRGAGKGAYPVTVLEAWECENLGAAPRECPSRDRKPVERPLLPDFPVAICSDCGARSDEAPEANFRWNGRTWEHRCAGVHPQVGYWEVPNVAMNGDFPATPPRPGSGSSHGDASSR